MLQRAIKSIDSRTTFNEIIDLNRINNDVLRVIIVKKSVPNIFSSLRNEKNDYDN